MLQVEVEISNKKSRFQIFSIEIDRTRKYFRRFMTTISGVEKEMRIFTREKELISKTFRFILIQFPILSRKITSKQFVKLAVVILM